MIKTTIDYRTEAQKKRDLRDAKMYEKYLVLKEQGLLDQQAFRVLSPEFKLTTWGVMDAIKRYESQQTN